MAMYKRERKTLVKRRDKDLEFGPMRKKFCRFCVEKVKDIDYKDIKRLEKFINDRLKMISRKYSGTCAKHQRKVSTAIKHARYIGLLPYVRT